MIEQRLETRWVWPFELTRELGSGAMGKVYQARYIKNDMLLAVKFLPEETAANPVYLARFEREMEVLRGMKHPCIVRCFGGTTQGKDRFYAMELVEGGSIHSLLETQGKIPWRQVAEYGLQMCSALEYTHAQGVIHRDVKPANFLLTKNDRIKLSDFGLALLAAGHHLTAEGKTVGTLLYMSPEQITGTPTESVQTDLYGLGCVFYEMLTGRPPFEGLTAGKIIHQHLHDRPPRVRDTIPEVPVGFDELIQHLMRKVDIERPSGANEVAARLKELLEKEGMSGPVSTTVTTRMAKFSTRSMRALNPLVEEKGSREGRGTSSRWILPLILLGMQLVLLWSMTGSGVVNPGTAHWESLLKHPDTEVRLTAVRGLAEQGEGAKPALPELFRMMQGDPKPEVREAAATARNAIQNAPRNSTKMWKWLLWLVLGAGSLFVGWRSFNPAR